MFPLDSLRRDFYCVQCKSQHLGVQRGPRVTYRPDVGLGPSPPNCLPHAPAEATKNHVPPLTFLVFVPTDPFRQTPALSAQKACAKSLSCSIAGEVENGKFHSSRFKKRSIFWAQRRGGGERRREEMIQKQLNFEKNGRKISCALQKKAPPSMKLSQGAEKLLVSRGHQLRESRVTGRPEELLGMCFLQRQQRTLGTRDQSPICKRPPSPAISE